MPNQDCAAGLNRVSAKEKNTQPEGRTGSGTPQMQGPATRSVRNPNETQGGGINRATRGSGAGQSTPKNG